MRNLKMKLDNYCTLIVQIKKIYKTTLPLHKSKKLTKKFYKI